MLKITNVLLYNMTGGSICSVAICKNNSKKLKETGEHVMFFNFPKDPRTLREWVIKCHRGDKFNPVYKRVCSKHFTPDDYEDALQARIMETRPKKLKKEAVPSLFLLPKRKKTQHTSERSQRAEKKARRALVETVMLTSQSSNVAEELTEVVDHGEQQYDFAEEQDKFIGHDDVSAICSGEMSINVNELLQQENKQLKQAILSYEYNEKVLKEKIFSLEKDLKEANSNFEDKAKRVFKSFLTKNQVEIALKKKTKARWMQEELSRAFTLRYFSKRCYVYLRETLKYPLPGLSTLQQWAANIDLRSGVLEAVLRIMHVAGRTKTKLQKTTVLCFDEIKVGSQYECDQKQDEVIGPHSSMQVIMARGLFENWKQPIYIEFDTKVTKSILNTVVSQLHNIDYNVVACVSDCGGGNQGLWKELNITPNQTFSQHPDTNCPIYFFADVPHLLKLLRNWFVDTGFVLNNGSVINTKPVLDLIENGSCEISSCHKLTTLHVKCERAQRQNVRMAAELFSNTTATALQRYSSDALTNDVGNFIELVNRWFDVMNSYAISAEIPSKKPYGLNLEQQNATLDDMESTIKGMVCCGKITLQVFQKGILISIKSLRSLYADLKTSYDISYLLTHRLNQDCLANFFSEIRTSEGLHDHPTPLSALYRIRMILLGRNPGITQKHTNVDVPDEAEKDEYLVAGALRKAQLGEMCVENPEVSI